MDLLLIRLEKIDNDFYESLIKFISDHGYSPKVVVRNTDILSFHGLKIISSKHQVLLHDKEIKMKGRYLRKIKFMTRFGEKAIFSDSKNIIAYINKIRKKIEPDPAHPIYILTVWGIGYKFNEKIE